jgi:hypothetical protein
LVPNLNYNGTVTPGITFRAWDRTSGTNGGTADVSSASKYGGKTAFSVATETAGIKVTPVNDAPVVATSAGATTYTCGGAVVKIDPNVMVSDADNLYLEGATVSFSTSGFHGGSDVLAFTPLSGNPVSAAPFAPGATTLTLTGHATLIQYRDALRAVTFKNTAANPVTTAPVLAFRVYDGKAYSNVATKTVNLNRAPVVTTSAGATTYPCGGTAVKIDPSVTVSDANDTTLKSATVSFSTSGFHGGNDVLGCANPNGLAVSWNASTGVLTLTGSASVATYQAALRSATFRNTISTPVTTARVIAFKVYDGKSYSNVATKTVNLVAAKDAPMPKTVLTSAATKTDAPLALSATGQAAGSASTGGKTDVLSDLALALGDPTLREDLFEGTPLTSTALSIGVKSAEPEASPSGASPEAGQAAEDASALVQRPLEQGGFSAGSRLMAAELDAWAQTDASGLLASDLGGSALFPQADHPVAYWGKALLGV